jgi:hypothetical protein
MDINREASARISDVLREKRWQAVLIGSSVLSSFHHSAPRGGAMPEESVRAIY